MRDPEARLLAQLEAVDAESRPAKYQLRRAIARRDRATADLDRAAVAARAQGLSWQELADELGISRQSAWARYHDPDPL